MIDLTKRGLPCHIKVAGESFSIYTDFRKWLQFQIDIEKEKQITAEMIIPLLKDNIEPLFFVGHFGEFAQECVSFLKNENPCPKDISPSTERVFDVAIDSDYVYSAFKQAYGIDLCDIEDLHIHKFNALLLGLPNDTKLSEIMSMRAYKKSKMSYEEQCEQHKQAWALPTMTKEQKEEIINELNELFYNS